MVSHQDLTLPVKFYQKLTVYGIHYVEENTNNIINLLRKGPKSEGPKKLPDCSIDVRNVCLKRLTFYTPPCRSTLRRDATSYSGVRTLCSSDLLSTCKFTRHNRRNFFRSSAAL